MRMTRYERQRAITEWLTAYHGLWLNAPAIPSDDFRKDIVSRLKHAGLISQTTYWKDVNLIRFFAEARDLMNSRRNDAQSETQATGRGTQPETQDQQEG